MKWSSRVVGLLLALLVSCGKSSDHANADRPWVPLEGVNGGSAVFAAESGLTVELDGTGFWVSLQVPPDDWLEAGLPGVLATSSILGAPLGTAPDGTSARVSVGSWELTDVSSARGPLGNALAAGAGYALWDDTLFLRTPDGQRPEEAAEISLYYDITHPSTPGEQRVSLANRTGRGFPLWHDQPVQATAHMGAEDSELTAWLALRTSADHSAGRVRLHVRRGAAPQLFETLHTGGSSLHSVHLPLNGEGPVEFELESEHPVLAVLIDPGLRRPDAPVDERSDVIFFLADTFRADNMAIYGSEGRWTPELDKLAASSLVFQNAWAPSSWTLPSHASFFTGRHPHEHGATRSNRALPPRAETVAESFARAGYRTVAVTDSVFVSARYGLDQGFALFDEEATDIEGTLERVAAVLEADDGRPLCLFVQTYEAHEPYGKLEGSRFDDLSAQLKANRWDWKQDEPLSEGLRAIVDELELLYRIGVQRLDASVGRFIESLEERDYFDHNYFVFTSDHGEAFGEHGAFFHGNSVWEEILHVPLFIRGGSVGAGIRTENVSLHRIPTTLAQLANIAASPEWSGPSLLDVHTGIQFGWGAYDRGRPSKMAAREGDTKWVFPITPAASGKPPTLGALESAYDLGADPGEFQELEIRTDDAARIERSAAPLLQLKWDSSSAKTSADDLRRMAKMGYVGD